MHSVSRNSSHITPGQRTRSEVHHDSRRSEAHSDFLRTRSMAHGSISTRSADLSQRVGKVESGLSTVNDKLDKVLDLLPQRSTASTPRRPTRQLQPGPGSYLDFEKELHRADPQFTIQKGKDPIRDFYVNNAIPRPFMFMTGPGFHSQKDKAAHRDKITFHEYVLCFTNMMRDRRACPQEDWPHLLDHLNQVVADAQNRPWPNVRNWSDTIFSRIEAGDITWADKAEIQFDRMRLSLAPVGTTKTAHPDPSQQERHVVCPDFNARRCKNRSSHTETGITYLHSCAWCYAALGNRNLHTVIQCENKLRINADRHTQPNLQFNRQQTQAPQYVNPPPHTHNPQQHQKRPTFTTAIINNQPTRPKNDG